MPVNFSASSIFSALNNYIKVRYGAIIPITDTELNEMQDIQNYKRNLAIKQILGNGFLTTPVITVADGTLVLPSCILACEGDVLEIAESMEIAVALNDVISLKITETELDYQATIYNSGNLSGGTALTNNMLDARVGEETSRRIQKQFELVKSVPGSPPANTYYLSVATVTGATTFTDARTPASIQLTSGEVVSTAQANKVLKLDANAKLPASITGDANTVDGLHFRNNSNALEWSVDGASWNTFTHHHDDRYFTETELGNTTDNSSGADRIGATTISELTGTTVQTLLESLKAKMGTLSSLTTTAKTSIVLAINELVTSISTHSGLTTTAHGGIVSSNDPRLTDSRTPTAHSHNDTYFTETEINTFLAGYYTESEVNALLLPLKKRSMSAFIYGELAVATKEVQIIVPYDMTIITVWINADTPSTGASIIVDIHKNGTTIFTNQANRPTLTAGVNKINTNNIDVASLVAGDIISIDVDQIGSGTKGSNLSVAIICEVV